MKVNIHVRRKKILIILLDALVSVLVPSFHKPPQKYIYASRMAKFHND